LNALAVISTQREIFKNIVLELRTFVLKNLVSTILEGYGEQIKVK